MGFELGWKSHDSKAEKSKERSWTCEKKPYQSWIIVPQKVSSKLKEVLS
jgi:hypothetical protein